MKEKNLGQVISIFNENRIRIMLELFLCKEIVCGCDLVKKINIPKNLLSYHISFLKENGLVEEKKCGQKKNYQLSAKGIEFIKKFIEIEEII